MTVLLNVPVVPDCGGKINARISVDWEFFHGHSVTAEKDRCKWTAEPNGGSSFFVQMRDRKKVERKISKVLDESEKMQNFSLFRGFHQACWGEKKKKSPTLVVWNAKLTVLLSPP